MNKKRSDISMFNLSKNTVPLGTKQVKIPKLTYYKLEKINDHFGILGDFLVKLFLTPEDERAALIAAGTQFTLEEIYELTGLLSETDSEKLKEEASFTECTEFLKRTWEENDMARGLKNVKTLLPPMAEQFVTSIVKGMEKGTQ